MRINRFDGAAASQPGQPQQAPARPAQPRPEEGPEILARRPAAGQMRTAPRPAQPQTPAPVPAAPAGEPPKAKNPKKEKPSKPKKEKPAKARRAAAYEEEDDEPGTYRRPRWHLPLGCLFFLAFIALILLGGREILALYGEVNGAQELSQEVGFKVDQGATVTTIAQQLEDEGLIEHGWLFRYYAQYSGKSTTLQYGTHMLRAGMSYNDILKSLAEQVERRATVTLTFPEGSTAVAIAQQLADNGLCTVEEFLACADGTDGTDWSKYDFWAQIPDNPGRLLKCEGYLFPNTYEFYTDEDVDYYVDVFYGEFARQTADLNAQISASGMTLDQAVILASFIQEEAGFTEGEEALLNNQRVAACFYNRLNSTDPLWSAHRLESNASSYITRDEENNYLWNSPMATYMGWRDAGAIPEEVLAAYDTYRISGLPAGAITNPGRVAIEAALTPDAQYVSEGYYFFVTGHPGTDVAGQYFFAKTADEHVANVQKAGWG